MKPKYHEIGESFPFADNNLVVVEDDSSRENNCESCFLENYIDCRAYRCNYEDRKDKKDVHFELE